MRLSVFGRINAAGNIIISSEVLKPIQIHSRSMVYCMYYPRELSLDYGKHVQKNQLDAFSVPHDFLITPVPVEFWPACYFITIITSDEPKGLEKVIEYLNEEKYSVYNIKGSRSGHRSNTVTFHAINENINSNRKKLQYNPQNFSYGLGDEKEGSLADTAKKLQRELKHKFGNHKKGLNLLFEDRHKHRESVTVEYQHSLAYFHDVLVKMQPRKTKGVPDKQDGDWEGLFKFHCLDSQELVIHDSQEQKWRDRLHDISSTDMDFTDDDPDVTISNLFIETHGREMLARLAILRKDFSVRNASKTFWGINIDYIARPMDKERAKKNQIINTNGIWTKISKSLTDTWNMWNLEHRLIVRKRDVEKGSFRLFISNVDPASWNASIDQIQSQFIRNLRVENTRASADTKTSNLRVDTIKDRVTWDEEGRNRSVTLKIKVRDVNEIYGLKRERKLKTLERIGYKTPFVISCPAGSYETEGKQLKNYLNKRTGFKSNLIVDFLVKNPIERGASGWSAIRKSIEEAEVVFFVMTLNAYAQRGSGFDSHGVQTEFAIAYALDKPIVPVFVNAPKTKPPSWMFEDFQTYSFYPPRKNNEKEYNQDRTRNSEFNELLEDLYMRFCK